VADARGREHALLQVHGSCGVRNEAYKAALDSGPVEGEIVDLVGTLEAAGLADLGEQVAGEARRLVEVPLAETRPAGHR
jgi:hypothetical protein